MTMQGSAIDLRGGEQKEGGRGIGCRGVSDCHGVIQTRGFWCESPPLLYCIWVVQRSVKNGTECVNITRLMGLPTMTLSDV